jgi:uncharacterized protein involved in exopolysaccharide biosynthesis
MVIKSRALADSLVQTFHLRELCHVKQLRQAREKLADWTTVSTPKEGQVEIAVEARTPALAVQLANGYARFATLETVRLKSSLASQRRVYLEQRLVEVENELVEASQRMRTFEEQHRAVNLPDQARATLDAQGGLQAQVALLETELAATRRFFTDASPQVQTLRDRVAELRRQTRQLQSGGVDILPGSGALPALKQQYLKLTREQASLTTVSELLRRFYEQARVEEANPVPTFSVLDAPELPERASRPARGLTVILATALSLAASIYWSWRSERAAVRMPRPDAGRSAHRDEDAGQEAA